MMRGLRLIEFKILGCGMVWGLRLRVWGLAVQG